MIETEIENEKETNVTENENVTEKEKDKGNEKENVIGNVTEIETATVIVVIETTIETETEKLASIPKKGTGIVDEIIGEIKKESVNVNAIGNINAKRREKENERDKEKKIEGSQSMAEAVGAVVVGVAAPVIHLADDASMVGKDPGQEVAPHPHLHKSHLDMRKVVEAVEEEVIHHLDLTHRLEMMKSHRSSSMLPN